MKLTKQGNSYLINRKKKFRPSKIDGDIVNKCFEFAYEMAFGKGHHRDHRTGGQERRLPIDIFRNTLQGKIAEVVLHNALKANGIVCNPIDFDIYGKGIWDDTDIEYSGIKISVKSAAYFSNLLLLETKDWDSKGHYLPNKEDDNLTHKYDYFVMVRIEPNTNALFKNGISKTELKSEINTLDWFYDIAGCCSLKTVKHIIKHGYILPQNAMLNGRTPMDAENYYIQAGDLKTIEALILRLKALK